MTDVQVCRVFPGSNRQYQMPASPKFYHKSRTPKVMFLAVCAKPRQEYGFDDKAGIWHFTTGRPAKRSNIKTGTVVVGETIVLEDVHTNAAVYHQKLLFKDGVFDMIRCRMLWVYRFAQY